MNVFQVAMFRLDYILQSVTISLWKGQRKNDETYWTALIMKSSGGRERENENFGSTTGTYTLANNERSEENLKYEVIRQVCYLKLSEREWTNHFGLTKDHVRNGRAMCTMTSNEKNSHYKLAISLVRDVIQWTARWDAVRMASAPQWQPPPYSPPLTT